MRILSQTLIFVVVLAVAVFASPPAKADTLDFTITGGGSTYIFSIPVKPNARRRSYGQRLRA